MLEPTAGVVWRGWGVLVAATAPAVGAAVGLGVSVVAGALAAAGGLVTVGALVDVSARNLSRLRRGRGQAARGRGVLVGVGVATAAPELHDAITRPVTKTRTINSQGQKAPQIN